MRGIITKIVKRDGRCSFFITGEDSVEYYSAFGIVAKEDRKYIWKGNGVTFDDVEITDKSPKARHVVPDKVKNAKLDVIIPEFKNKVCVELTEEDRMDYITTKEWKDGTIKDIKGGTDVGHAFMIISDGAEDFFAPFVEIIEYTRNRRNIKLGSKVMFIPKAPEFKDDGKTRRRLATRIVFL